MEEKRTDVNELGEFGLIDQLTKSFTIQKESTVKSIGDDAAVINNQNWLTVVSTDSLVEGIHFDMMYTPLKHLGYKAVSVNVSDIYAMNAIPQQILVSLAISNRFSVEALEEFYAGVRAACDHYKIDLVGGDTTSSNKGLFINITAIGRAMPERVTYRSGARPGDILCVSGDLGAAYLGLQILEREKMLFLDNPNVKPELKEHQHLLGRQLKPEARGDIIAYMAENDIFPTSMIDVSDGLSSEILHICKESDVGVLLEESKVPIHPETEKTAISFNMDPITCALSGGEDYELLFTVDSGDLDKVRTMPDVYIIGDVADPSYGAMLKTTGGNFHKLTAQGWKHFEEGEK